MATIFASLIIFLSLLWISSSILIRNSGKKKKTAPEAAGSWPLIGHLHLLGGPKPPHFVLGDMADKHGPIYTIKMGVYRALVVNDWESAKECLATNDRAFASRPKTLAMDLLGYGQTMLGFSPYGSHWRQMRKLATLELLSSSRLESFRDVRESEVSTCLRELYRLWDKSEKIGSSSNKVLVKMERWLGDITLNVIFRIIVGKSVGYCTTTTDDDEINRLGWKQSLRDFFDLSGRFVLADALPFLRWLDIGGHEKFMKKTAKELDLVVEEWLKEHKEKRRAGVGEGKGNGDGKGDGGGDFMDLMLTILDDGAQLGRRNSDTINKATCLGLILAASDTTSITLAWALSLLVNNPKVLKKAQHELDTSVGADRQVQESDLKNLDYLQAILRETLRLYPAAPLSVPHESMEDCVVAGYHIPKGTRLLVNLWKMHHDPRIWSDPFEFQPERFLSTQKDFDVRGQNFEYLPFSSGRRMCPGVTFALQVMQLALAKLLHGFDFASPSGEPVDMRESIGLTNPRATPLAVILNPRLPSHLYG